MITSVVGSTEVVHEPVEFTGGEREYFGVWIVNLVLTLGTLGIYSAWAKVRRLQYFYRHTRVAGAGFDFHGQPAAILRGRLIALALFTLYTLAGWISPTFTLLAFAVLAAVMPWLLSRSFRFRLRNTSHRDLRFGFTGPTSTAYLVFLGLPVLTVLSVFVAGPLWHHRMRQYQHANSTYGQATFSFKAPVGGFYLIYLALLGLFVATIFALVAALMMILFLIRGFGAGGAPLDRLDLLVVIPVGVAYATAFIWLKAFATARIQNLVWSHTTIERHSFVPLLEAGELFRLLWVNLFVTVLTIGLFRPFAQIRLARYYAGAMRVRLDGPVESFSAGDRTGQTTAAGEEAAEFFDFDIAF